MMMTKIDQFSTSNRESSIAADSIAEEKNRIRTKKKNRINWQTQTKMWQMFSEVSNSKPNYSIVNGKAFTEDNVLVYNIFVYNIPQKVCFGCIWWQPALMFFFVCLCLPIADHRTPNIGLFQEIWGNKKRTLDK